jgi:SAM-dependent methyltransferase
LTGLRAAAGDVRHLPFAPASFDGVLSTSTLDHLPDAAAIGAALAEFRRVLRVGGRLVLTLDNPANPLVRLRNALPPGAQRRTGLVAFPLGATLGRAEGCAALEAAGFEVPQTAYLLHAPHVVGTRLARFGWWERRALPFFDRLSETRAAPITGHFVAFLAVAR